MARDFHGKCQDFSVGAQTQWEAEATNALAQDWSTLRAYAHPQWCLIPGVLNKALNQGVTIVIVTPCWPTWSWFPQLMEMLLDFPLVFLHSLDTQVVTPSPSGDCLIVATPLQLVAWKVSGVNSEQRQFQKQLLTLSWPPGERESTLYTLVLTCDGHMATNS